MLRIVVARPKAPLALAGLSVDDLVVHPSCWLVGASVVVSLLSAAVCAQFHYDLVTSAFLYERARAAIDVKCALGTVLRHEAQCP